MICKAIILFLLFVEVFICIVRSSAHDGLHWFSLCATTRHCEESYYLSATKAITSTADHGGHSRRKTRSSTAHPDRRVWYGLSSDWRQSTSTRKRCELGRILSRNHFEMRSGGRLHPRLCTVHGTSRAMRPVVPAACRWALREIYEAWSSTAAELVVKAGLLVVDVDSWALRCIPTRVRRAASSRSWEGTERNYAALFHREKDAQHVARTTSRST